MSFLTDNDYLAQISREDLATLVEDSVVLEPEPTTFIDLDGDGLDDLTGEPEPEPLPTIRELAERNAQAEVASYLRGRYDMEAAYDLAGSARNAQLVMILVDVALWNLMPRVTFRMVSEVRESRYKAALAWLKLAEAGKSNPDLPKYTTSTTGGSTQRGTIFRFGSQPARSHSF